MADWHRTRRDIGLRALGLGTGALSCAAVTGLMHLNGAGAAGASGIVAALLAAAGFLCASAGSAMLVLGAHLFDAVEVSERWRRGPVRRPARRPWGASGTGRSTTMPECPASTAAG